ncbi:hypothetical protein SLA2020_022860 [Shorea laevis]
MKDAAKKKKKKRSRPPKAPCNGATNDQQREQQQLLLHRQEQEQREQGRILDSLVEAFDSVSLEEAASAYEQAGGDPNKAAQILSSLVDGDAKSEGPDPSTSGSSSSSGSDFMETGCLQNVGSGRGKQKKRVGAATGTVSTVLGKDYTRASPRKHSKARAMEDYHGVLDKEEAEQFLCSMLGDESDLSMAVVRDVLCQCGYNVEKALDVLLDLSASSCERSGNGNDNLSDKQDPGLLIEQFENLTDGGSECVSYPPEYEFQDSIWSLGYDSRDYSKVLTCSEAVSPTSSTSNLADLPQKVLESLFNMSKSPEHEPSTMDWRSVVKKMQSLGPGFDVCTSSVSEPQQGSYAKGDEYHVFRKTAKEHWDSMRTCYQKAAEAHSKGKFEYAAYLSDQGKIQNKLARAADEKASQDIFKARNKGIENVITIDLHGQHVKQAMRLLKLHLLLGNYVPSIQTLRVITGCGSRGVGKSVLKQSVIELLEVEGIEWSEENRGTLLIEFDGYREFSFLDTESDTE